MLGIRAIQRVKESRRGDGKGYFRIATRQRSAARTGCKGGHKTSQGRRSAAQPPHRAMGCDPSGSFASWSLQFGVSESLTAVLLPPCSLLYTCCWMRSIPSAGRSVLHEGCVSFAITEVTRTTEQHHHRFQSPQKQLVKIHQHVSYS